MLEFRHTFEEAPKNGDLSIETDTQPGEKIKIHREDGKNIWVSANKAGWLHLACICAELGTRDLEPGYHVHVDFDFQTSSGGGQECSFEVAENGGSNHALQRTCAVERRR